MKLFKFSYTSSLVLLALISSLMPSQAITTLIEFDEAGFNGGGFITSGSSTSYNVLNDTTGAELTSDDGGAADFTISYSSTINSTATGTNANAEIGSSTTNGSDLRLTHEYKKDFANSYAEGTANNPGGTICHTVTITFGAHLVVTDFVANLSSLNTVGIAWETSIIALLDASGNPFSTIPTVGDYNSTTSYEGSPSTGVWQGTNTGTVSGVGDDETASGVATVNDSMKSVANRFNYDKVGLTAGTQVGGIQLSVCLEDVRGQNNNATGFTTTIQDFTIDYTLNEVTVPAVPEPSSAMLSLLGAAFLFLRRRRG